MLEVMARRWMGDGEWEEAQGSKYPTEGDHCGNKIEKGLEELN